MVLGYCTAKLTVSSSDSLFSQESRMNIHLEVDSLHGRPSSRLSGRAMSEQQRQPEQKRRRCCRPLEYCWPFLNVEQIQLVDGRSDQDARRAEISSRSRSPVMSDAVGHALWDGLFVEAKRCGTGCLLWRSLPARTRACRSTIRQAVAIILVAAWIFESRYWIFSWTRDTLGEREDFSTTIQQRKQHCKLLLVLSYGHF